MIQIQDHGLQIFFFPFLDVEKLNRACWPEWKIRAGEFGPDPPLLKDWLNLALFFCRFSLQLTQLMDWTSNPNRLGCSAWYPAGGAVWRSDGNFGKWGLAGEGTFTGGRGVAALHIWPRSVILYPSLPFYPEQTVLHNFCCCDALPNCLGQPLKSLTGKINFSFLKVLSWVFGHSDTK